MRVKISTNPPLPPLRAWFPLIIPSAQMNISSLKSLLCMSLPAFRDVSPTSLRLSIDGFELLDRSTLTIVRDGDLICVDLPSEDTTPPVYRGGDGQATQKRLEPAASHKRKRRTSTPSSSSSESDGESTTSPSESESETSDSESTSDSSLSLRKAEPPKTHVRERARVTPSVQSKRDVVHPSTFVPPGHGKPQTRLRNLRRRLKRMHEHDAPGVSADGPVSGANAVVSGKVQAITPVVAEDVRDGRRIPMLMSLSLRNKNKAKNFKSLMGRPLAPKIIFGDQEGDAGASTSTGSLTKSYRQSRQALPRLIPPSSRSSLPPNLLVTSIDVEAGLHREKKKRKMRIEYDNELEEQGGDISLDYGDDVDTHTVTAPEFLSDKDLGELEEMADRHWAVLDKPTSEKQVTQGMMVGYKALGINPVTHTPEQCVTLARVVSCDSKTVVVRPYRAREQVSFSGPVEEANEEEEGHTWDDIINGDWRLMELAVAK